MTRPHVPIIDTETLGEPVAESPLLADVRRSAHTPEPKPEHVADVTYGRWDATELPVRALASDAPRPDPARWSLYLVRIPYSFRFATGPRRATVRFQLAEDVIAHDLAPTSRGDKPSGPVTYRIDSAYTFTCSDDVVAASVHQLRYARLVPVIAPEGAGEPLFGWGHAGPPGVPVEAGVNVGYAVLVVPRGRAEILVRASAVLRLNRLRHAHSKPRTFSVSLPPSAP